MGLGGGRSPKSPSRPAKFYVGLPRGLVKKVDGGRTTWSACHVARPTDHHLVSYWLNQVGNPSLDPYKYPSIGENQNTRHILEIPLAKLPFLV
jgi:hypothetical protein